MSSKPRTFNLPTDEKAEVVDRLKAYFADELDQEIGQFDAEFLLDFFLDQIGPILYNRGVYDARAVVQRKLEDLDHEIDEIAKATG